jgi:hypothetical protein
MIYRFSVPNVACAVMVVLIPVFLYAQQDTSSPTRRLYVLTGNEASLSGSITFTGKPLKRRSIDMTADPSCYEVNPNHKTEDMIVNKDRLVNVLVFVKNNIVLDSYTFELPPTPATLEHKGCRYVPHVMGMRLEQLLNILNSDPTQHNTHPVPKLNREWNQTQPVGAPPLVKTFQLAEAPITFRDNQHPWERAYVGVFNHPFFSVSDELGKYEIKGLPPGQYTVVAWHERFGEKTVDIMLVPGEARDVSFTFDAKDCTGYGCPK